MSDPGPFTLKGTPLACHRCGKNRFTLNPIPYQVSLFDEQDGEARPDDLNHELVSLRCSFCGFEHRYRAAFIAEAAGEADTRKGLDGFR